MAYIKSKCEGCEYNDQTHGKRFWKCNHPIPCEDRKISEYGCKDGKYKIDLKKYEKGGFINE